MKRRQTLSLIMLAVCTVTLLGPMLVGAAGPAGGSPGGTLNLSEFNPLKDTGSLQDLIVKLLEIAMQIGVPLSAVMIMYAGFLYVTAGGKEAQVTKAHQALLWSVVGAAVLMGAFAIVTMLKATVEGLK